MLTAAARALAEEAGIPLAAAEAWWTLSQEVGRPLEAQDRVRICAALASLDRLNVPVPDGWWAVHPLPSFDLAGAVQEVLAAKVFRPSPLLDGRTALPAVYHPGSSPLVLVLGENGSGKSLFRSILVAVTSATSSDALGAIHTAPETATRVREVIHLSMAGRSSQMGSLIYGNEARESTGVLSAGIVSRGIANARMRQHRCLLFWDEPDIGAAPQLAAGIGVEIAKFVRSLPPGGPCQAAFVTTHSPALVDQLRGLDPHVVFMGDDPPASLDAWSHRAAAPEVHSPAAVADRARARRKDIQRLLDAKD